MKMEIMLALRFGGFALEVDETLDLSGITAIMGASGSGKSTLLRALAGLETPARARIILDGAKLADSASGVNLPAYRRGIGYVFQDARLFSHRSVCGNLRFAQQHARPAVADRAAYTYGDVVMALDLARLLDRSVANLSGGECQRAAIAAALLANPRLLLLDEPLSALNIKSKAELLPYIRNLPKHFGIPLIYVSHAVDEIAQLADEVMILTGGRVVARGEVHAVLERPEAADVSGDFEAGVLLDAVVRRQVEAYALTELDLGGQRFTLPRLNAMPGMPVRLRVRARDVAISLTRLEGVSIRNQLQMCVTDIEVSSLNAFAEVKMNLTGSHAAPVHLRGRITLEALAHLDLKPGQIVWALVKSVSFDQR